MCNVEFKILKAGYCFQNEICSIIKGKNKKTKFYAMFVLIKHKKFGNILFDTGYSEDFYNATKKFPYLIYSKLTPVEIDYKNSAKYQLEKLGIKVEDVSYIIISHFHADHIGALKDFKNAKFICLKKSWENIKNKTGLKALKEGFLPDLLPLDFKDRIIFIDDNKVKSEYKYFEEVYDIFSDNSIIAFDLSGHSEGQIGILLNKDIFFVADACWYSKSYRDNIPPPLWVRLILGKNKEYLKTLEKLHLFYEKYPQIKIIPSHCNEFWSNYV